MVGGRLVGPDVEVDGAVIDSREMTPDALFVPVVAERDGHDFIEAALAEGAAATLSATEAHAGSGTAVVVDDTTVALQRLGSAIRDRIPDRVVGVTGSVGKTTVKDLCAAVLATTYVTASSVRSFNNELGVPLTLVNAADGVEATVVEMGARGPGQVAELCRVARPTIGVVTTVGLAHTELFGTLDAVVRAKGELIESLPDSGTAVLNAALPEVAGMATRTSADVLTFGEGGDVHSTDVSLDAGLRPRFQIQSPWGSVEVEVGVRGAHQVSNALGAAAVGLAAGVALSDVAQGLGVSDVSPWRMDLQTSPTGALVLNDAYNANPTSTEAALRALAGLEGARRTAILGSMAELGDHADAEHVRIAAIADDLGIRVIAVDAAAFGDGVDHVGDHGGALELLGRVAEGDAVLVKGSRVAGLEVVAAALLETAPVRD